MELFTSLPGTADRRVLLCTDLHAGNVLAAQRRPWLVIDPKPYVGDPPTTRYSTRTTATSGLPLTRPASSGGWLTC